MQEEFRLYRSLFILRTIYQTGKEKKGYFALL